jgi:hypothetical protein
MLFSYGGFNTLCECPVCTTNISEIHKWKKETCEYPIILDGPLTFITSNVENCFNENNSILIHEKGGVCRFVSGNTLMTLKADTYFIITNKVICAKYRKAFQKNENGQRVLEKCGA